MPSIHIVHTEVKTERGSKWEATQSDEFQTSIEHTDNRGVLRCFYSTLRFRNDLPMWKLLQISMVDIEMFRLFYHWKRTISYVSRFWILMLFSGKFTAQSHTPKSHLKTKESTWGTKHNSYHTNELPLKSEKLRTSDMWRKSHHTRTAGLLTNMTLKCFTHISKINLLASWWFIGQTYCSQGVNQSGAAMQ